MHMELVTLKAACRVARTTMATDTTILILAVLRMMEMMELKRLLDHGTVNMALLLRELERLLEVQVC